MRWSNRLRITYLVAFAALVLVSAFQPDGSDRGARREAIARSEVVVVNGAARMFRLDHHRWPSLPELSERDRHGRPYLESVPRDPWDHDYEIRALPRDRCEVRSRGPDGEPDTGDDIVERLR